MKNKLKVTKTDTIKVLYAQLPATSMSLDFLIRIETPIALIPQEVSFSVGDIGNKTIEETLKHFVLDSWKKSTSAFIEMGKGNLPSWIHDISSVELVECDLLVPKVKL